MWEGWANEVAADVYAFALAGWAPLPALANVVDGSTAAVFRVIPGDPHPFPWVRVMFNVALCRSWFGRGPWDRVAASWRERHRPERAPGDGGALARHSVAAMGEIVATCTRVPMRAFRGRPLTAFVDPRRASPAALAQLVRQAGASLTTSSYLQRRESIRILTCLTLRGSEDPARATEHRRGLQSWLAALGGTPLAKSA